MSDDTLIVLVAVAAFALALVVVTYAITASVAAVIEAARTAAEQENDRA